RVYEASDTVSIAGRVRNVSLNSIASGLTLQVKVLTPGGTQIYSSSSTVDLLVPQAIKTSVFPLQLTSAAPGVYVVQASLFQGGAQVGATQEAAFSVLSTADTGTGLAGAITVTRVVQQGESSTITATAKNLGNATIDALAVSLKVADGAGTALAQWTETPFAL